LVGNFDGAAVTQQLTALFGSWRSTVDYERAVARYKPMTADSKVFPTPDKANAIFLVGENLQLKDSDPGYAPLELANALLGGGFLNSRLATRIRQKDGLSYSVGSQLVAGSQDPVGGFTIFAIYAPQNAAKVETAAKEEVERALADGFTSAEITAAKSGLLQSLLVNRSTDIQLANELADHLHLKRDFTWDAQFEKSIESAAPEAIHQSLEHFIDPTQWVIVKAGDFAKAGG
jgi:zinc protease